MTVKDKQSELISIINDFTDRTIEIIDSKLKDTKPEIIEYEYIDLFAEAFFSIKAFCVLMKEGLVSSASAVIRIALEQTSIVALVSENEETKKNFLNIKKERNLYYSRGETFQKKYERLIKEKYELNNKRIKQYFDYGWYKPNGKPTTKLKPICEAAGFSEAYDLVDDVINGFVHGQVSIYKFTRKMNGADLSFVDRLFEIFGRIFFKLASILFKECGNQYFRNKDIKTIDLVYALSSDLTSRLFEKDVLSSINNNSIKIGPIKRNVVSLDNLLRKYNSTDDIREKYLLSQAYLRYFKQLSSAMICFVFEPINDSKIDCLNMQSIFKNYAIDNDLISSYNSTATITIDELLLYLDSRDDCWLMSTDDNDYIVCAKHLLSLLYSKMENSCDK